jgi:mannose-6-phosphate isomerase
VTAPDRPIALPANQPPGRFYAGGDRIAAFRGTGRADPATPEDWIGSVTAVRGESPAGLTTLPGTAVLLRAAVERDPVGWLGPDHAARWGADPRLLVKLLDAGQRLPVHAHPDDAFAAARLGAAHGKAEAWYVLGAGTVHLGLREDVDRGGLDGLLRAQDRAALLALLNVVELGPRSSVLVPPGTLHAIGEGMLIAEVQQPEDLSILLEWAGFDIDGAAQGHLGLGFDLALQAVDVRALPPERLAGLVRRDIAPGRALVPEADRWFRLDRVTGGGELPSGFAVIIGEEGELALDTDAATTRVARGTTLVSPAAAGRLRFRGEGSALVARPPAP